MHISWVVLQMLKTTTKGKKLTTWWPWAWSPQTYWCLRIDNVKPCDTILLLPSTNQRIVHKLITYPATPLPHLAFKNALLTPIGELGYFEHSHSWTPCLVPYNKRCAFLHHNSGSVDGLYSEWARGPKFGLVTIRFLFIKHILLQTEC